MSIINIGLSGMSAANAGLSVTAHNTSNAMTPGYSRQRVGFGAQTDGQGGAGVGVSSVERMADNYLNQQIYKQKGSWGYNAIRSQYMAKTETLLNNDSTSINTGLDRFNAALSEASTNPQDIAYRQTIISQSQSMVQRFNNLNAQLDSQAKQVGGQLDAAVSEANALVASIASMNDSLRDSGGSGKEMTDLLDARDEAIRQLSSQMDINTTYNDDGTVTITLDQGQPLVSGSQASALKQTQDGGLELQRGNGRFVLDDKVGGTIGGLINYRDVELKDLQKELDVMAYSFATQFNDTHSQGFDLNGDPGQAVFGGVDQIDGAAKNLTLMIDDPKQLAFASKPGEPGNSENLQQLIDLKNAPVAIDTTKLTPSEAEQFKNAIATLDGKTIYSSYTGMTGDWAIKTAQLEADTSAAKSLVEQAEGERGSVSGVNLDEEAANIMTYTQMYQANAQVISTAQQLFDITLSMFR
ncbi:flagellar hook-associated protein FlgK [Photobacterium sp. SDRW27]|uniref:flagellar hook-associated protein FlgK n=1 Tax=Photobacterium obscurum TaxID=2829490 RepID=UPI002243AC0D|nr:flagellar hook-associated protein FlgK [Photobacterium obscurum]MCW8330689.1 flagellar hook-associated protein FlgK [Photobacterium obscurum]